MKTLLSTITISLFSVLIFVGCKDQREGLLIGTWEWQEMGMFGNVKHTMYLEKDHKFFFTIETGTATNIEAGVWELKGDSIIATYESFYRYSDGDIYRTPLRSSFCVKGVDNEILETCNDTGIKKYKRTNY